MSDQQTELDVRSVLDGLVPVLRRRFTRACHGGRLEQIEAHVATLRHLVEQLPDEEAREAEYEDRLMQSYDSGTFGQDPHTAGHDAKMRLNDALQRRKAG